MSPVEIWANATFWAKAVEKDFDFVFNQTSNKKVLVVESQDEYDYCWAMQLIYGGEIRIVLHESGLTVQDYLKLFTWVFTTWDPHDRNRI